MNGKKHLKKVKCNAGIQNESVGQQQTQSATTVAWAQNGNTMSNAVGGVAVNNNVMPVVMPYMLPYNGMQMQQFNTSNMTQGPTPPPPPPPPPPSKQADPIKPKPKPVLPESDESSEEGEIDEETEDIGCLYDEFEESTVRDETKKVDKNDVQTKGAAQNCSQEKGVPTANAVKEVPRSASQEDKDGDSDFDDMFGDGDGEALEKKSEETSNADPILQVNNDDLDGDGADDDELDMFGESGDEEETSTEQPATQHPVNMPAVAAERDDLSKGEQPGVLSTGLGFVLDYSPDVDPESKSSDLSSTVQRTDPTAIQTSAPNENDDDDDIDSMFGGSTSDEDEHVVPSNALDVKPEAMTAASALAQARQRATAPQATKPKSVLLSKLRPQTQKKSVRFGSNQTSSVDALAPLQNVTKPADLPKRTYYPEVHSDKFWSTLRGWDFVRELNDVMKGSGPSSIKNENNLHKSPQKRSLEEREGDGISAAKPDLASEPSLPDAFDSVAQYKALWSPLLINEAKAQLLSEVISAQSSPSTAWMNRTQMAIGVAAKVEVSRSAKDIPGGTSTTTSLEPTVVVVLRPITRGAGIGSPVNTNDLLLFVHQSSTIELALKGTAFDAIDAAAANSFYGKRQMPQGRLGFVGHALNHRSRSVDGLLARVSQKLWSQFASLGEMFVIRIGSNVTGKLNDNVIVASLIFS